MRTFLSPDRVTVLFRSSSEFRFEFRNLFRFISRFRSSSEFRFESRFELMFLFEFLFEFLLTHECQFRFLSAFTITTVLRLLL